MHVRYNTNIEQLFEIDVRENYSRHLIIYYTKEVYMMNSERRIRNNRIRRQRQLRRNLLMLCFTLVLIVTYLLVDLH